MYLECSGELDVISATIKNAASLAPLETSADSSFNSVTSATRSKVFEFRPIVNVIKMVDISPQLGVLVQTDPINFRKLVQSVIFQQARCLQSEEIVSKSQVLARPVIAGLISFYDFM